MIMAVMEHLKSLRMPGFARSLEGALRLARERNMDYEELLLNLLGAELDNRNASAVKGRIKAARFPEQKTLDTFDFDAADLDRDMVFRLARCEWVENTATLFVAGPVGTGKTHIATALGLEACRRRFCVLFARAPDLVRDLVECRDEKTLGKLHRKLLRQDLLILDELGFVPFGRVGGELLFNVLSDRYEHKATLITTNLAFGEWHKVFGDDEKLAAALLDRLAHHSEVLVTQGSSYRMREKGLGVRPYKMSQVDFRWRDLAIQMAAVCNLLAENKVTAQFPMAGNNGHWWL